MKVKRVNFDANEWEYRVLKEVSDKTGLSMSECLRRLIVSMTQDRLFGELFPPLSGQVHIGGDPFRAVGK